MIVVKVQILFSQSQLTREEILEGLQNLQEFNLFWQSKAEIERRKKLCSSRKTCALWSRQYQIIRSFWHQLLPAWMISLLLRSLPHLSIKLGYK